MRGWIYHGGERRCLVVCAAGACNDRCRKKNRCRWVKFCGCGGFAVRKGDRLKCLKCKRVWKLKGGVNDALWHL